VVRSELAVPVRLAGSVWGVINLEDTEVGSFTGADVQVLEAIAAQLGSTLRALELYDSLERAYVGTAEALSAVLEAKDPYTAHHSDSIAERAVAVGRELGIDESDLRVLRFAAAFHDIGKIAVPRSVLNKPGPLTETERLMVEQHTVIGERILAPIEFLRPALPLVRHAHERWDGKGYPDRLAGEQIPLGARILFVCDAHDAMTTDRPYRRALGPEVVLSELRSNAGTQFDPQVVDALLQVLEASGAPR
jgi:HD-GYP domain-containing protein (c-di-GMP phosphodiesterase class II)